MSIITVTLELCELTSLTPTEFYTHLSRKMWLHHQQKENIISCSPIQETCREINELVFLVLYIFSLSKILLLYRNRPRTSPAVIRACHNMAWNLDLLFSWYILMGDSPSVQLRKSHPAQCNHL